MLQLAYDSPYIDWLRPPDSNAYLDAVKLSFKGEIYAPNERRSFGPEARYTTCSVDAALIVSSS